MKKIFYLTFLLSLTTTVGLIGQWDLNGSNPYDGPTNPIIDRDSPYLIFDMFFTGKSGLRFRESGDLVAAIVYQGHVDNRISFGPDLLPNNAPVVIHLDVNEMDGFYSGDNDGLLKVGEESSDKILFDRDDIQAFGTNNYPSPLRLNYHGGNVNIGNGGITYINATDKTGIGTTSPIKRLDVNGDIALSNGVGSIDFYEGSDRKAFIDYDGSDLFIANQEDTYPHNGDIFIDAQKRIYLSTLGLINASIKLETVGPTSPIDLLTNEYLSHINLTTLHDSADINLTSEGDITLENTGTGNLNFITHDSLRLSTFGYQAPVELSTTGVDAGVSILTNGGNSDINIEADGSTSDINIYANDNFGDIEINAGSDVDIEAGSIIRFWNNNELTMIMNGSGQIGIGTSNPQFDLQLDGNMDITGELTAASDEKLKKNITPLTNASSLIAKLNPVSYLFRTDEFPTKYFSKREKLGLIAQELETVLPNLVSNAGTVVDKNGAEIEIKSVNYIELIPLLIKCNQEQNALIETQSSTLESLNGENTKLKDELEVLKLRIMKIEAAISEDI
ncbi:MAG: tail fiber domain-containing protein [Saprospiraceae bacterium]|nr:tail fiber domain-containing protein [Saprospiraceae bacterium]